MCESTLASLSREELESEILRLRAVLQSGALAGKADPCAHEPASGLEPYSSLRKARSRAVLEGTTEFAIVVTDPFGRITEWNSGAEHVMGWTAGEMYGQYASCFFIPEDVANGRVEVEMAQAQHEGHARDERWHLRKDGQRFWASGEMILLTGEAGEHLGFVKILRDRTAEHLAGVSLKETQERYRLAAEATNDAIWDWDFVSGHVLWNDALTATYGHQPDEVQPTGEWWMSHIHPEDRSRVEGSIHQVIKGKGAVWSDEYRFQRADGSYALVLDRGRVIRDASGHATRMIGAMLNTTQLQSVEMALRKSEERFRAIIETIGSAFAIVQVKFDADDNPIDYRFLEANPAFELQAGVNLRGKWVTEFAPNLEQFWFDTYGHVAKTGEPATFENYANTFERWFDVRAVRVGDPDDRQIAILFSDVTERRNAEERLRVSEALARENIERVQLALAAGAIIGTWHWDLLNDKFTVDEAFSIAFGLDPALGRQGLSLEHRMAAIHPDDRSKLQLAIDEVMTSGGPFAFQYRVRHADGRYYWIEANGRVNHTKDGVPLSFPGVLIDVEERRAVEAERDKALAALRTLNDTLEQRVSERTAELMQTEEKLRQSQKMEAVGQLTGGLAHDFNNLLAGISGALELMETRIAQGRLNDVDRYLVAAKGATKRAAALTHRLLAFSRRQTLDPRPIDVNDLIGGMTELIQRTVGPEIQIETVGAAGLWPALADSSQLENSLLNLCINARDAMPDGGRITIETANRWMDHEAARANDLSEGQYLSLCVTDTGVGIPADIISRVFEPFFTTKPIGQGTGLGLSMIYGFARQSGGQVRIYSEPDQGTTVCIYLPRYQGASAIAETNVQPLEIERSSAGETVLIVDDEPTVRMLVMDTLTDLGYAVVEAADSADGLKILESDIQIDLLISDVGLPGGMNGRQMADAGRQIRPGLKALFITGYAENAVISNGHLERGMQVLTKPFAVDTLAARVREMMNE